MNANNENSNDRTNKTTRNVWVVYFVGFDDSADSEDARVEPLVGCERIETTEDPEQMAADVELAALLRGGRVVALVEDDAERAELTRAVLETEILRYR